jgi:cullin 5
MICRLREVGMPADFVNKLARMFQDIKVSEDLNSHFKEEYRSNKGSLAGETSVGVLAASFLIVNIEKSSDSISIKILNAGAWARGSERVAVSLPLELEDYIPEVEDFYKKKHSGRKLQWYHHMSNGTVSHLTFITYFWL